MDIKERGELIKQLADSHATTAELLQGVDLERRAYEDWRIREIIGHLATWDRQVAKSIRAYIQGAEYAIQDLKIDDFNQEETSKQRKLTPQQVYDEWVQARQDFKNAVQEVPPDLYSKDMLYPWGSERGTVSLLVEYMVHHDKEHNEEILKAIGT
jgi:hypothetical protein